MKTCRRLTPLGLLLLVLPCLGWDENGHITVTRLAHKTLPTSMPAWVRSAESRGRLEYLANEPDRWRGVHHVQLDHINSPEHYIDVEELADFDLTLAKLPPLRREFADRMANERAMRPGKFPRRDPVKDKDYTRLTPGFLPYRIAELQWRLTSSWSTLKTYEKHPDRATESEIRNARENVLYDMGVLSHYVGDGSQPLHLTIHHHGWVGANPKGYTTRREFHHEIDGGVLELHGITPDALLSRALPPVRVGRETYWQDINAYLQKTFDKMEPLYELEKSGELKQAKGKAFIEERLLAGGSMLAGVWLAAYENAGIDDFIERRLLSRGAAASRPEPTSKPGEAHGR